MSIACCNVLILPSCSYTDHRPVAALIEIEVSSTDAEARAMVREEVLHQLHSAFTTIRVAPVPSIVTLDQLVT